MKLFKKWGKWEDLAVGYFDEHYLLQGRRSEDGEVQFKVVRSAKTYGVPKITLEDIKKLITN